MKVLMLTVIILCILLLIIFFPIKIKVRIIYENNKLKVYIFNKLINQSSEENKTNETNKTEKRKSKIGIKNTFPKGRNLIKNIYYEYFSKAPYKGRIKRLLMPSITIECNVTYGFDDASITGISYGILCTIPGQLRHIIEKRLKLKGYMVNIEPKFNSQLFKFKVLSIFSLNLVQIIYILKVFKKK
jgi:hypothetical protein